MLNEQSSDLFSLMINNPHQSDRSTDTKSIIQQLQQNHSNNDLINQFTKKILDANKPTLVSIGNLKNMPFIDDLKH